MVRHVLCVRVYFACVHISLVLFIWVLQCWGTFLFPLSPGACGKLSGWFLLCKRPGSGVQEETRASERRGHLEEQSHHGELEQRREPHRAELWGESGAKSVWMSLIVLLQSVTHDHSFKVQFIMRKDVDLRMSAHCSYSYHSYCTLLWCDWKWDWNSKHSGDSP